MTRYVALADGLTDDVASEPEPMHVTIRAETRKGAIKETDFEDTWRRQ